MVQYTIRELFPETCEEDFRLLMTAFAEIWNAPENLTDLSESLEPFPEEVIRGWLSHHLQQGGGYLCAIDHADEVRGIAALLEKSAEEVELFGLGVQTRCKRVGIGRALVCRVWEETSRLGALKLTPLGFKDNLPMRRLVDSLGFLAVGSRPRLRAEGVGGWVFEKGIRT